MWSRSSFRSWTSRGLTMTDSGGTRDPEPAMKPEMAERERTHGPIEEYARGEIRAYHGIVNKWLLAVYAILLLYALALVNLLFLLSDALYNVLGGLLPLVRY